MAMNDKEKREKFGINMAAVEVTRVFKKPLEHFQGKGMDAFAWVLVNDDTSEVIHANIYNGKVGRKWKPRILGLDTDKLQKKLKTYVPADIADCSVAIPAGLVIEIDPALDLPADESIEEPQVEAEAETEVEAADDVESPNS